MFYVRFFLLVEERRMANIFIMICQACVVSFGDLGQVVPSARRELLTGREFIEKAYMYVRAKLEVDVNDVVGSFLIGRPQLPAMERTQYPSLISFRIDLSHTHTQFT